MCRYCLSCVCLVLAFGLGPSAHGAPTPAKTLAQLPAGVVDQKYSPLPVSVAVGGTAPFTYSLGADGKPDGLSIDPLTGVLSGTPTAAAVGNHRVRVVVTDYGGKEIVKEFLLRVSAAPAASTPAPVPAVAAPPGAPAPVGTSSSAPATAPVTIIAPTVVGTPTAGDQTITVNGMPSTPAVGTTTLSVITLGATADKCVPGTPALQLTSPGIATGNTATVLRLHDPLTAGSIACVYQSFVAVKGVLPATDPQGSKPFVVAAVESLISPRIETPLHSGQQTVTVVAQPTPIVPAADANSAAPKSASATPAGPRVELLLQDGSQSAPCDVSTGFPVPLSKAGDAVSTAPQPYSAPTDSNGIATLTLASPLAANEYVCAFETYQNADGTPGKTDAGSHASGSFLVVDPASLGRVTTYFTGGILLANDDSNSSNTSGSSFSTAHEFLDLNVDKSWLLPGCYLHAYANQEDEGFCEPPARFDSKKHQPPVGSDQNGFEQPGWFKRHYPGIDTYFDARLTAIPVAQSTVLSGVSGTSMSSTMLQAAQPNETTTTSTTNSSSSQVFNTSQKTAKLGVGLYLPFLLTRWDWDYRPNSLFLGPIAKVGFDTLTGPTTQTVIGNDGSTTTLNYERLYNFYGFGGRVGHMGLTNNNRQAPELLSYLDIIAGPFSNLESYICHPAIGGGVLYPGSNCGAFMFAQGAVDSRKRLYRVDLEGMLKIPHMPLVLGFNANIGQRALGAAKLDQAFQPPDDLRFLFGTRFDISSVLSKLGLVSGTTPTTNPSASK